MTLLASVLSVLKTISQFNQNYETEPVCILWPDKERLWEPLADAFRRHSPAFLQLGDFAPEMRTGPALWLKCVLARLVEGIDFPDDAAPIIYLPGVGRIDLREVESCPPELQPLIELQHRGVIWSHPNGKDWTVSGFLASRECGLGLDVGRDQRTLLALQQALLKLAETPVDRLQGQHIDADFLLGLLHPDPHRDALLWLNNSQGFFRGLSSDQWDAFTSVCRSTFQFDPEKDGEIRAAELLGLQKGAWKEVWNRFKEAPHRYPGIPEWLRRACPPKQMELKLEEEPYDAYSEAWPQVNEEAERNLREVLAKIHGRSRPEMGKAILENEVHHAPRRKWVWAELGKCPIVTLWDHLGALVRCSERPLAAKDMSAFATAYETHGWQADAAALRVLAEPLSEADRGLVEKVVRDLYLSWAEESALNFQHLAKQEPAVFRVGPPVAPPPGTVIVFADALRWDVGHALMEELKGLSLDLSLVGHWSALPSVTPTAKPAVSPVSHLLGSDLAPEKQDVAGFRPTVTAENKALTPDRFRKLLEAEGIQFLGPAETGNPEGIAWTEHGRLDADGHHDGTRVALRCAEHVQILAERVQALAAAGWKNIRVVTDHGWLLIPRGLPKVDLPKFLTDTRWGRCAILADGAQSTLPVWPWTWSPAIQVVCAPGVGSFLGGLEYAHGGVSPQECRIPEIHVRNTAAAQAPRVKVSSVRWVNLRCRVTVEGEFSGVMVDIRLRPADRGSSVVDSVRGPDSNGMASLALVRDELLGASASVVILGTDDSIVRRVSLILGEDIL